MTTLLRRTPLLALTLGTLLLAGCDSDGIIAPIPDLPDFFRGTDDDPQIGFVVNSLDATLELFQLGDPTEERLVELGASNTLTPVGFSIAGDRVAVPLGNAASVALVDLGDLAVERFFVFPSGNATGSAFVDGETLLLADLLGDRVGRVSLDQPNDEITELVDVTPAPTDIEVFRGRALVLSGNLDDSFVPIGEGVVTALDPATLEVVGTVETGGRNPSDAAVGPDGLLYVVNTGNFVDPGSLAIIDPLSLELLGVVEGFGVGPGSIAFDPAGRALVSGFFFGTLVWDPVTRTFVRGPDDPLCAPLEGGGCRGASDAVGDVAGRILQTFFGSPAQGLEPRIFVYDAATFALEDSIPTGSGPAEIRVRIF